MKTQTLQRRRNIWRDLTQNPLLSRRTLAERYDVHPATVANDLHMLRHFGYIEWRFGCIGIRVLVPFIEVKR